VGFRIEAPGENADMWVKMNHIHQISILSKIMPCLTSLPNASNEINQQQQLALYQGSLQKLLLRIPSENVLEHAEVFHPGTKCSTS
jgi:hypothetical protein